ncbi:hypothetical protein [Luteococcus peritonei]|uniref:Methyl-accepting transducer domain-containing protein n=1 Tax=Luteococcus peritonei TaxID=88874 RepID=A0ABW4RT60_9ACTN
MPSSSAAWRGLRARMVSIIGVILLPLLIASGFIWATSGNGARLNQTEAAIVNLDEGSTLGGKPIHLGQTYALELKNQQGPNFTWRYGVSMADAQDGLASGRYSAALVIPPGFSRVLTGTAKGSVEDKATLVVERSPLSGVSDQVVFSQLSGAATHSLASDVTKDYLDDLFVSSSELGESLTATRNMADEARQGADQVTAAARQAQAASGTLDGQATTTTQLAATALGAATTARTTTDAVVTETQQVRTQVSTTTSGSDAQTKAVDQLSGAADDVSRTAGQAATSTRTAAGQAKAAGSQGQATQTSADAVAKAAAANKKAATEYRTKVATAAQQQKNLADELTRQGTALNDYVKGTTTAAGEVQKTVTTLREKVAQPAPQEESARQRRAPEQASVQQQIAAQAKLLRATAEQLKGSRPQAVTIDAEAVTTLQQQANQVATSATSLAKANATVVSSTKSASSNLSSARNGYQAVIEQMSGTREVSYSETVKVKGKLVLPSIPACPRSLDAAACRAYQAGAQAYRGEVIRSNNNGAENVTVKGTTTVSVTPDAARLKSANEAAATAQWQLTTAASAASKNQAALEAQAATARTMAASVEGIATRVNQSNEQLAAARSQYDAAITQLESLAGQLESLGKAVDAGTQDVQELKTELAATLNEKSVDENLGTLATAPKELTAASGASLKTAQENAEQMKAVDADSASAQALAKGTEQVDTTVTSQKAVVEKLQGMLTTLNTGMAELGTTMGGLTTDATAMQKQTSAVSDNAAKTAGQVGQLNRTLEGLQKSIDRAATDSKTAADRAAALQKQVTVLQQSSGVVKATTTTVTTTAQEQAGRIDTLSKKVAASAKLAPSYSEQDRQRLTDIVTTPIGTEQANLFRNVGWVSMLMLLSLWAGSMGMHSLFKPVSDSARTSTTKPLRLLYREMRPAALISIAQAVGLSLLAQAVLHMSAHRWLLVTGAMVLAGFVFAAVNHALLAFLKVFGRLVAVAFALVAGASLVTQAYPQTLDTLSAISPISPALDTVRGLMTGAAGNGTHLAEMLAWLVAGVLFSALAILRAREPEPLRVPTVHEQDTAVPPERV